MQLWSGSPLIIASFYLKVQINRKPSHIPTVGENEVKGYIVDGWGEEITILDVGGNSQGRWLWKVVSW